MKDFVWCAQRTLNPNDTTVFSVTVLAVKCCGISDPENGVKDANGGTVGIRGIWNGDWTECGLQTGACDRRDR